MVSVVWGFSFGFVVLFPCTAGRCHNCFDYKKRGMAPPMASCHNPSNLCSKPDLVPPHSRDERCYSASPQLHARSLRHTPAHSICQIIIIAVLFQFCFLNYFWEVEKKIRERSLPLYVILHVISQVPIVCLFATVYYVSIYLSVDKTS